MIDILISNKSYEAWIQGVGKAAVLCSASDHTHFLDSDSLSIFPFQPAYPVPQLLLHLAQLSEGRKSPSFFLDISTEKIASSESIKRRKFLARMNFPALIRLAQRFCKTARSLLSDSNYQGFEEYNLIAALETFSRDAFSLLTEEALKNAENELLKFREMTYITGSAMEELFQNPIWNDLRIALSAQIISIASLIESIWRLQHEDKILKFIEQTSFLYISLASEEFINSGVRKQGEELLTWDAKAMLLQSLTLRLQAIPIIFSLDEKSVEAKLLFALFAASIGTAMQTGETSHYNLVRRWTFLNKKLKELSNREEGKFTNWFASLQNQPKGELAHDFIALAKLQTELSSCLKKLHVNPNTLFIFL